MFPAGKDLVNLPSHSSA